MARPVIWGAQPMVCNLTRRVQENPEYAELYRFLLECARFYHANRDLLFDGEMLSPAGFHCGTRQVKFQQRMIFTKETACGELERELPALLHSVWRAPSGAEALVLANYTAEPQSWEFDGRSGVAAAHSFGRFELAWASKKASAIGFPIRQAATRSASFAVASPTQVSAAP